MRWLRASTRSSFLFIVRESISNFKLNHFFRGFSSCAATKSPVLPLVHSQMAICFVQLIKTISVPVLPFFYRARRVLAIKIFLNVSARARTIHIILKIARRVIAVWSRIAKETLHFSINLQWHARFASKNDTKKPSKESKNKKRINQWKNKKRKKKCVKWRKSDGQKRICRAFFFNYHMKVSEFAQ